MGADFCMALVDVLDGSTPALEALRELYKARITRLSEKDLEEYVERTGMDALSPEELHVHLLDAASDVLDLAYDPVRDVALFSPPRSEFMGKPSVVLVSGGMSWGDEPTQSYGVITKLDYTGVLDSPSPSELLQLIAHIQGNKEAIPAGVSSEGRT